MPARLSYEVVKRSFEAEGYTLLSTEYENGATKLDFICPEGHRHSISWSKFKLGRRCAYCCNAPPKHYEEIKSAFEARGYTLVSTEYVQSKEHLDFICPNGHRHSMSWEGFNAGKSCRYCTVEYTHEDIAKVFAQNGYQLLSRYERSDQKLEFICDRGHQHSIAWEGFQQGARCAKCAGNAKLPYEDVKADVESKNHRLITSKNEYKNTQTPLKMYCPKEHVRTTNFNNFLRFPKCRECILEINRLGGEGTPRWDSSLTDEDRKKSRPRADRWRTAVLKRDDYICQSCGYKSKDGKRMVAHHLYGYKSYPLLREDPDNGTTLYFPCHYAFHSKYGWDGTTKKQFVEFLAAPLQKIN